jgi:hypothetical protein
VTTKVSETGRGSARSPATGRKPISVDRSIHRRTKGGFEELNIPAKPEQKKGQTRSRLVYHMQDERTPQEQMSNIHAVYGSMNAKSITNRRTMVRYL